MSHTPEALVFPDTASMADLGRYAARARRLDAEGAMRLQAVGSVLAAWVCVLPGRGLLGDGTVLGLRTFALAEEAEGDVTIPLGAVTDRTARTDLGARFPIPPTRAFPQWGALSAPRGGWEAVGEISESSLVAAAKAGITEIGEGAGPGAGALAVADLRARVWGRAIGDSNPVGGEASPVIPVLPVMRVIPGLTAGAGFAAYGLGFLVPGATVPVHRSGPWLRLTCPGGYVLLR